MLVAGASPSWAILTHTCDGEALSDLELERALVLELPAKHASTATVTMCSRYWSFEADGFEALHVDVSTLPEHVRRRAFALAVRAGLNPTRRIVSTPFTSAQSQQTAALLPRRRIELDLGLRTFLSDPPSVALSLVARTNPVWRVWLGLELGVSTITKAKAEVTVLFLMGLLGVRLLEFTFGDWALIGDVFFEIGVISSTVYALTGPYVGSAATNLMWGGSGAVGVRKTVSERLDLEASLRGGYDRGVRVGVLGTSVLTLSGPFIAVQLGVRF